METKSLSKTWLSFGQGGSSGGGEKWFDLEFIIKEGQTWIEYGLHTWFEREKEILTDLKAQVMRMNDGAIFWD